MALSALAFAQHKVADKVAEFKAENAPFTHFSILTPTSGPAGSDVTRALKKQTLATLKLDAVNDIVSHRYQTLQVEVPYLGQLILVDLYQSDPFQASFHIDTDKQTKVPYQKGVYYRGIVHGNTNSVASFSFFHNEATGIVSAEGIANLVIGKLDRPQNVTDYVIYSDADFRVPNGFNCSIKEDAPAPNEHPNTTRSIQSDRCVTMYFEIDHNLYLSHSSSVSALTNWFTAVFNNVQTLYANDDITVSLKSIYIWTEQDPYDGVGDDSSAYLSKFHQVRPVFDGDVGQLIGVDPGGLGGLAVTINGLCSQYNYSYSDVDNSFSNVPTYSWTVQVITHEMGHLLGSPHTHACAWNGNNTMIDGCGPTAGYTEGNCAIGPIPSSSVKGTIMSYCHLISGVGISFNNGFGPQPQELIYNTVNAAACLSTDCINTCINTVADVQVTQPTPTSASVTWTDQGSNANWEVSVVPFSSADNWVSVTGNSYSTTAALNPNTFYKVRVRPFCDGATPSYTQTIFATPAAWCDGVTITDTGGTTGSYTNNQLYVRTLIPNLPNRKIHLEFTSFNLEQDYDFLSIYNGPDTSSPTFGDFTGTDILSPVESTAADGSLTLKFYSDEGQTASGYVGNVTCTPMLGIGGVTNDIDFTYAPNPTTGAVSITSNTEMPDIKVYNVQGQLLYAGKNNGLSKSVDLSAFASGTYFFKIRFAGEKEANFRIVKN
jgi:hypothetical protein